MDTIYDLNNYINDIRHKLSAVYADETLCQQYAWWILQSLCKKTKTELIIQETVMLFPEQQRKLEQWMKLLVEDKMPLQYILGSVPFADLEILIEPPTLIPRPETEEWCLYIVEHLLTLRHKKIKIADIATGSGCIALACAYYLPQAEIVATDIADTALELIEKNIEHSKIINVSTIKSDLFSSIPQRMMFDIILSNPPYISPT